MTCKDFAWLVPFVSFFIGYQIFSVLFSTQPVDAPALVGKPLASALRLLSQHNLNARILAEKPDADLPEGIILEQMPEAGTKLKPRQNIFLVISKRPPVMQAPLLVGLAEKACLQKAKELAIRLKLFNVASRYPTGTCVAQTPSVDQELENKTVIAYIARPESRTVIFPDVTDRSVAAAQEFLSRHGFTSELFSIQRNELVDADETAQVIDQKPRAGALINLDKPVTVRLYIA